MADDVDALSMARGRLPRHVAIVMDGNGRWAQQRALPRTAGHREGANSNAPCRAPLGIEKARRRCGEWSRPALNAVLRC